MEVNLAVMKLGIRKWSKAAKWKEIPRRVLGKSCLLIKSHRDGVGVRVGGVIAD